MKGRSQRWKGRTKEFLKILFLRWKKVKAHVHVYWKNSVKREKLTTVEKKSTIMNKIP